MLLAYETAAPNPAKSGQKIWPEPDLAGFAKKDWMPDLLEPKSGTSLLDTVSIVFTFVGSRAP